MRNCVGFYIDGRWTEPARTLHLDVIDPATEATVGCVALGSAADVGRAVAAARRAFPAWSRSSREERLALLRRIVEAYQHRFDDLVKAVSQEMGAPLSLARRSQVPAGLRHLSTAAEMLESYAFDEIRGSTLVTREPIGVCALITPWNWPLNQIACKVAPAIATGCTMVLKPSEIAPFSGHIFAEIMDAAGVPPGVFNLVHGDGPTAGAALAGHPDVDMVSFTGSTRAGVEVARSAAPTVKRVHQELGGKSPNIILDDEALTDGVARGVAHVMNNTGQSCNAPSRMLVPASRLAEAVDAARKVAGGITVGDPQSDVTLGPVVSKAQWQRIQQLIQASIAEGATLVTGGPGRPDGLEKGFYVRPTIFSDVTNDMTIAREEIFGPVLSIIAYDSLAQAIEIANDTPFGLAGYVQGADLSEARAVAGQLRAGQVAINGAASDYTAPFGGFKMSGNGREHGAYAFDEFVELKAVLGFAPAPARH